MKLVDASVAFKWLVEEVDSAKAVALADNGPLLAPDLLWTEVANALWRKAMRGDIGAAEAVAVLPVLDTMIDERIDSQQIAPAALALSIELQHPVHDCVYLAIARHRAIPLVTVDERLLNKLRGSKVDVEVQTL